MTYNQWMLVDPTRQSGGVPTRVLLGMEEVWQTLSTTTPQDGPMQFQSFGQYTANGGACLVVPEQCGTVQSFDQSRTTTHPDQHGAIVIPDGKGGLTLLVGNDGGVYRQTVAAGGEFSQGGWGRGANEGFHTLLPYGAAMAKDGTTYAGLQDNGFMKITPDGKQSAVYVGDGFFALVDPDNSDVAYGELPGGIVYKTLNGGRTFTTIDPLHKDADFVAPLRMDPADPKHLVSFGREVKESLAGPDTVGSCDQTNPSDILNPVCGPADKQWRTSYDLGTRDHRATRRPRRPRTTRTSTTTRRRATCAARRCTSATAAPAIRSSSGSASATASPPTSAATSRRRPARRTAGTSPRPRASPTA